MIKVLAHVQDSIVLSAKVQCRLTAYSEGCAAALQSGGRAVAMVSILRTEARIDDHCRARLGAFGRAAIYAGVFDAAGGAELLALLLDLDGQLPRRSQHQHDGAVARLCARCHNVFCQGGAVVATSIWQLTIPTSPGRTRTLQQACSLDRLSGATQMVSRAMHGVRVCRAT